MSTDELLVLDAEATRAALGDTRALMVALTTALTAIADGTDSTPPRIAARAEGGLLGAMPGYVPGLGLAAKLISVFADPQRPGRSTHRGVVVCFDEHDGRPTAVLDAEPLTALRTAATSVIALRALARPDATRVTVIGTGTQASAQLTLLAADERWDVTVAGRDAPRVAEKAGRFGAHAAASIEAGVRAADAVLCCTGAREPVLRRAWLADGVHVGSVGCSEGPELDARTIEDAALFAEWPGAVGSPPPAGAHELQEVRADRVTMLGDVLAGRHPGRSGRDQLTVFKSTGHAALDVAAAAVAAVAAVTATASRRSATL
jgi:ornithine cyclodeaminase/alanine dehydrogenase-like protein (mu-crystallin family)